MSLRSDEPREIAADVNDFLKSIHASVGMFSGFLNELKNEPGFADLSEADRLTKLADFYEGQYREFSRVATDMAARAEGLGDQSRAEIWRNTANMFVDWADERSASADRVWLERTELLAKGNLGKYFGPLGDILSGAQIVSAASIGDLDLVAEKSSGVLFGLAGAGLAALIIPATWPVAAVAIGVALGGAGGTEVGERVGPMLLPAVRNQVGALFDSASGWIPRRDPLVLDLDGDGIETLGADGSVLFDHEASGVKRGTGWIAADDGLLVLDRNGNGVIDDGRELFGDNTLLEEGGPAQDGFEALRELDTNGDGRVDAEDARYAELRVWQDLNADGVSQSQELSTLGDAGVESIATVSEVADTDLGNGNVLRSAGTFTWSGGNVGAAGSLDLAENRFHRAFTDRLEIPETMTQLPTMGGSGAVRDLLEAATLSESLRQTLEQYAHAGTRAEQVSLLDRLLDDWAESSGFADLGERADGLGESVRFAHSWELAVNADGTLGREPRPEEQRRASLIERIGILEVFNDRRFFELGTVQTVEDSRQLSIRAGRIEHTVELLTVGGVHYLTEQSFPLSDEQATALEGAYQSLRESAYAGLLLQTRLKPFIEAIELSTVNGQIGFDFAAMQALMGERIEADAANGVLDVLEFRQVLGDSVDELGWDAWHFLSEQLGGAAPSEALEAVLGEFKLVAKPTGEILSGTESSETLLGGAAAERIHAFAGNDVLLGLAGDDQLAGGEGQDRLEGGAGDDWLDGGAGGDVLRGGAGNDTLGGGHGSSDYWDVTRIDGVETGNDYAGGTGDDLLMGTYYTDTYRFDLGDGADVIIEDGDRRHVDTLIFGEGISAADVSASRDTHDLVLAHANGSDRITVRNWFAQWDRRHQIERIEFADGTAWNSQELSARVANQFGTDSDDTLVGLDAFHEILRGGGGHDTLYGLDGQDRLEGGAGDDLLDGGARADVLTGGAGNDTLGGAHGSSDYWGYTRIDGVDTGNDYAGGAGDDTLRGSYYTDTYRFDLGDGADVIAEDGDRRYVDKLLFGEGISAADVSASRDAHDLVLAHANGSDRITVRNWFAQWDRRHQIERIEFADGTQWSNQALSARIVDRAGSDADETLLGLDAFHDILRGGGGDDTLYGLDGRDRLEGDAGEDLLDGGAGADVLAGGEGNDILGGEHGSGDYWGYTRVDGVDTGNDYAGGAGDDLLRGTYYADTYRFGRGDGNDVIVDRSPSGYVDRLEFAEGIGAADLWLARAEQDLKVLIVGEDDSVTIQDWYSGPGNRIESFELSAGERLLASQVDRLVMAMASFEPPAPGSVSIPAETREALEPVLAASWHT